LYIFLKSYSLQEVWQVYQEHSPCCRAPWTQQGSQEDIKVNDHRYSEMFSIELLLVYLYQTS